MSDDGDTGLWEAEYSTGWRADYRGFVVVKFDYSERGKMRPAEAERLARELMRAARAARADVEGSDEG